MRPGDLIIAKMFNKEPRDFYCIWSCSGEDEYSMNYMVKVGELRYKQPALVLEISPRLGEKIRILTLTREVGWISKSIIEVIP